MQDKFGVRAIRDNEHEMMATLYLQVSIVSQALIFVTRSRSWSFLERPGLLLVSAFLIAQLVRTFPIEYFLRKYILKHGQIHVLHFSGGNFDSCICQLGFRKNRGCWLGMGRCHLALQYCLLCPT